MFRRTIEASAAVVRAKEIDDAGLNRQTGTHNAQMTRARKDVEIVIKKQYPRRDGSVERPPVGMVIKGDSAILSSRDKGKVRPCKDSSGRSEVKVGDNVKATVTSRKRRDSDE